jgi:hypothetical protein
LCLLISSTSHADRYHNHEASKRIDEAKEHQDELKKLRGPDGDFHHGFNCGVLAASRLFLDQSDVAHINDLVCFMEGVICDD